MNRIILISLLVVLLYTTEANADACGVVCKAGYILQKVTERIDYAGGLFWSSDRLLYVNKNDPNICQLDSNGISSCTKLEELQEINSVYPIDNVNDKLIVFADKKVILIDADISQKGGTIESKKMKTITTITTNPDSKVGQSITDDKGRAIIGTNSKSEDGELDSVVYIINDDYVVSKLIPEKKIVEVSGLALSSDYKHLFVADCKSNVIYKYAYNSGKGSVGKSEIVFNMTEHLYLRGYIATLGMTKNNELWIGLGESGMVLLYNCEKKQFLQHVKLPTSFPTSISYGGPELDVLFIGTMKFNDEYAISEPGSGLIYAISGTATAGCQQSMLPKSGSASVKNVDLKNAYYMPKSDLEKLALIDGSVTI